MSVLSENVVSPDLVQDDQTSANVGTDIDSGDGSALDGVFDGGSSVGTGTDDADSLIGQLETVQESLDELTEQVAAFSEESPGDVIVQPVQEQLTEMQEQLDGISSEISTMSAEISVLSSVYDGSISSTYVAFFDRLSVKFGTADYVFYRSGQYTYTCYWGGLSYDGSRFTGAGLDCVVLTLSSSNYSSYYTWNSYSGVSLDLVPNGDLVYSSLGDYPVLDTPSVGYDYTLLFVVVVVLIAIFIRGIFSFTYRMRGRAGQVNDSGRVYGYVRGYAKMD